MAEIQDQAFAALEFQKSTSSDGVVSYHKHLSNSNINTPILVLLHGYPNSAYLWRHIIPLIPGHPLFVPDLPGYGNSAPPTSHDKVSVGHLILSALHEVTNPQHQHPNSTSQQPNPQPIILIGHDRGARISHHLHLSSPRAPILGFQITGLALLDIVPTLSQWELAASAPAATGFFHWSFLANPTLAVPMIVAYGGGAWAREMIARWSGTNASARARIASGSALEVYSSFFEQPSVVEATARDYEAGASVDVEFETEALREGRRIVVPLLLVYSAAFLPKRAKAPIREVWGRPWSDGGDLVTECPIGEGVGHFVPEEAPEVTAEALERWLKTF